MIARFARRAMLLGLLLLAVRPALAADVVLASTPSLENSGLLASLMRDFTAETGIEVRVLALGTGQALAVTARGDADLVLVHDPDAEQRFMDEGHGAERREVAWNDFIVIGPVADPARVAGGHDAAAALSAIAQAGAPFVSRGDNSGTHALERRLWRAAGQDLAKAGSWYRDIGGGMGAALNAAAAMGAYTVSDRGTWLSFGNKAGLRIVVEGGRALLNPYSIIMPTEAGHRPQGREPARRLAAWLMSSDGQDAIEMFMVDGERLFNPVAMPKPK